jgi:hypothetical protein
MIQETCLLTQSNMGRPAVAVRKQTPGRRCKGGSANKHRPPVAKAPIPAQAPSTSPARDRNPRASDTAATATAATAARTAPPRAHERSRCFGSYPDHVEYAEYHDTEWGVPVHDDGLHFEILILEGAQVSPDPTAG